MALKMRFLTAPWVALYESGAWLRHARHANECASKLGVELSKRTGMKLLAPVEANDVFIRLPRHVQDFLQQQGWRYHSFFGDGYTRLMCSWQTTNADIESFLNDVDETDRKNLA